MNSRVMVQARDVVKFYGDFEALCGVSMDIHEGEVVVICGPSGSGKSTFLRCINGLESIQGGDLIVDGMSVSDPKTDLRKLRSEVGMVFQQFNLYPHMTALQNITIAPVKVRGKNRQEAEQIAHELLGKVGIPEKAESYPSELSGGQQQRVAIARALAMQPKVMLFDEATSALDPEVIHEVLNVMLGLVGDPPLTGRGVVALLGGILGGELAPGERWVYERRLVVGPEADVASTTDLLLPMLGVADGSSSIAGRVEPAGLSVGILIEREDGVPLTHATARTEGPLAGRYRALVAPGRYRVTLRAPMRAPRQLEVEVPVGGEGRVPDQSFPELAALRFEPAFARGV